LGDIIEQDVREERLRAQRRTLASIVLIEVGFDEKAVHMGGATSLGASLQCACRVASDQRGRRNGEKKEGENKPQRIIPGRTKIMLKTGERRKKKKEQKS